MRYLAIALIFPLSAVQACNRRIDIGDYPDATVADLGIADLGNLDAQTPDLGPPDLGQADLGPVDLGTPDLGPADLGMADMGSPDLGEPDMGPPDLGLPDMGPPDLGPTDLGMGMADLGPADLGAPDLGPPDVGMPDLGPPDLGVADMGFPDAAPQDMGTPDSGVPPGPYQTISGQVAYYNSEMSPSGLPTLRFPNRNDSTVELTLNFPLEYFGTIYPTGTKLTVGTAGYILVGSGDRLSRQNEALPPMVNTSTQAIIAPFWDAMTTAPYGVYGVSNNHEVFVQWHHASAGGATINFSVRIRRGGPIIINYFHMPANISGTIGLASAGGTQVHQLACSPNCTNTDIPSGTIVLFRKTGATVLGADLATTMISPALPPFIYVGERIDNLDITFQNLGNQSSQTQIIRLMSRASNSSGPWELPRHEIGNGTISSLAPGATATVLDLPVPGINRQPGSYEIAATIEPIGRDIDPSNDMLVIGPLEVRALLGNCSISNTSLPQGTVGQPYSVQFVATGCPMPAWSAFSLPAGLTLDSSGLLHGTPTAAVADTFHFMVQQRGYRIDGVFLPLIIQ